MVSRVNRRTFLSTIAIGALMSDAVSSTADGQPALDPQNTVLS